MCIQVFAVPAEPNRVSAQRLSQISGLHVTKRQRPVKNALHFAREPGCSCSLLADGADWGSATWDLVPGALEGLAKALETLASEAHGFTFQAIWVSDQPESEGPVSLTELLRDVRANRVKNKYVYKVGLSNRGHG